MRGTSWKKSSLLISSVFLMSLVLVVSINPALTAQTTDSTGRAVNESNSLKVHKLSFSFGGVVMDGKVTTAVLPTSGDDFGDMNPIESPYGFGLSIDYNLSPKLRLFLDGNAYSYRKQVAVAGENSESFWVYEMTDYTTHYLAFNDDAYFDMRTTGFRIGVKYDFPKGNLRPWVGTGFGFYSWKVDYCTTDRSKTWGSATGTVAGATFLCGVDYIFGRASSHPMMISLYGDFASPVVNPVIDNLFIDGWTWDNSGGNHVMGPYRIGLSIGFFQ